MKINNSSRKFKKDAVSRLVARNTPLDRAYRAVCYNPSFGFMAVAKSGETAGTRFLRSFDGLDWQAMTSTADNEWVSISAMNNACVAVAKTGTQATKIARIAQNMSNFVAVNAPTNNPIHAIGNDTVQFYAMDSIGIIKSSDGATWTRDFTFTGGLVGSIENRFFVSDEIAPNSRIIGFIVDGMKIVWRNNHWSGAWTVTSYEDLSMETSFGDLVFKDGRWLIYGFSRVIIEVNHDFSGTPIVHNLAGNYYTNFYRVFHKNGMFLMHNNGELKYSVDGFNFDYLTKTRNFGYMSDFAFGAGRFVAVGSVDTGFKLPRVLSSAVSYE